MLNNYERKIENDLTVVDSTKAKISKEILDKSALISSRYLKGISIKDLAMQFDCNESLIEMILENKDIEIVSNKLSSKRDWGKKTKNRR